ncbi:AGE family epimerase/isomerase [Bordetella petrii]|uniref:AGE family epimerase/isomerase n=1 Tax=Bordetella petrii TaxID=94624 RepID=UPI001E5C4675|nr:AGE family epimerase/isomerase [Bordetella petrii]MCD0503287.1 AGE family epimerase/isomerase [Bordetella petrii]
MAVSVSSELSATSQALRRHFREVVLPLWMGRGFNERMGLPYESLAGDTGLPLVPQRYRAMACARQLYVYACAPDAAHARHADILFEALLRHFRDAQHGGWRYSIDPEGRVLDDTQDLYTHAFVVFACAAYFERSRRAEARQMLLQTAEQIESKFRRADGLYHAAMSADWSRATLGPAQNPVMHLTEAYLAAARVAEPAWFAQLLRGIGQGVADAFLHAPSQCIAEAPVGTPDNRIEPGHQFEWFVLLGSAPAVFAELELALALPRGCHWARQHGVSGGTAGVRAALHEDGSVRDASERIWAQTEYTRYLAACGDWDTLATQAAALRDRFLHPGGWRECLDGRGALLRTDMPSSTPYHLATGYAALPGA